MNAQQTKALITSARKVREILLDIKRQCGQSIHPAVILQNVALRSELAELELWGAIRRTEAAEKPASREKCAFCEEAGAELGGFSKKLKLRMAHVACAEAYHARTDAFAAWSQQDTALRLNADTREQREALRASLAYCACGGKAGDHREDRDGNLLECSHCDGCGQFHYQTDAQGTDAQAA